MTKLPTRLSLGPKSATTSLSQHLQRRLNARRKVERSITSVIERGEDGKEQLLPTSVVLDPLSKSGFSELRIAEANKAEEGSRSYFCPQCRQPLKIHAHHQHPGCADAAFFVHVPSGVACSLRDRGAVHANWAKYRGVQEGERHAYLKLLLAECLKMDPEFDHIEMEQLAVPGDRRSTRPDVAADHASRRLGVDVQLRTAYQHVIGRRERYYRQNGFHHVWVTDAQALGALDQQGFMDLYFNTGGRMLAIDGQCLRDTKRAGALRLVELSVRPKLTSEGRIINIWQRSMVSSEVVMLDRGERAREGIELYALSLESQVAPKCGNECERIRAAVASGEGPDGYKKDLSFIAQIVGGSGLDWLLQNDVWSVLVWLHHVLMHDGNSASGLQAATDTFLASKGADHWCHLANNLLVNMPCVASALSADTKRSLVTLRQKASHDPQRFHKPTIAAVFPRLAFALLSSQPRVAPATY